MRWLWSGINRVCCLYWRHSQFGQTSHPKSLSLLLLAFLPFGLVNVALDRARVQWRRLLYCLLALALYLLVMGEFVLFQHSWATRSLDYVRARWVLFLVVNTNFAQSYFNNLLCFLYSNYIGHRLARHLASLPGDRDYGLACRILLCFWSGLVGVNLCAAIASQHYRSLNEWETKPRPYWRSLTMFLPGLPGDYLTCVYVYAMLRYRSELESLCAPTLSDHCLCALLARLRRLEAHFATTNRLLELPILLTILSCTLALISSVCALVNAGQFQILYTRYLFYLIFRTVALAGSIYYCSVQVTHQVEQLSWHIRHRMLHWSTLGWLAVLRLDYFKHSFRLRLFSLWTVDRTLFISLIAFTLNYIVLLIQTEQSSRA